MTFVSTEVTPLKLFRAVAAGDHLMSTVLLDVLLEFRLTESDIETKVA
jgi:hypothetical protein